MLKYISNNIFYRLILLNSIQFYFLFKLIYIFFINDKSVKLYNNICFSDNINISIILNRILLKKIIHCINNNINVFSKYYFRKINQLKYYHYNEMLTDWRGGPSGATPFRFTCKEPDPETGLYYFGARYLDPKASRWMSADPAMGEYIPSAPVDDGARRRNESLPGLGGVFNYVNLHVYHYSANNPVKYVDPDGESLALKFGVIIGIALSLHSSSRRSNAETSFNAAASLNNVSYAGGGQSPITISAVGSRVTYSNITLERNAMIRLASSLPRGGLDPENYSDGKTSNIGTAMAAIDLGGSTLSNFLSQSESGANVGDVNLHYSKNSDGTLINWNIKGTTIGNNNSSGPQDVIFSKSEALNYLKQNRERLVNEGIYVQIENLFN